ncbi:MAG: hypothetical protein CVV05_13015 [Gammaproteobacteria bacterium HGW-Gammaproteobacteria-1]|jgi:hypothetical protein|nr:MAG: hypothetical protein CVV05_13015 [Gammaproteobacteria bacterium HGW-Gammaproteobacteria-1]
MTENLIGLDSNEHRDLKLHRVASYSFADKLHAATLAKAEVLQAALSYPVLFGLRESAYRPVALLSLVADENQFVEGDAWRASYIPAAMRVYPFRLAGEQVLIDASAPHFAAGEDGEALFTEDGEPAPALGQALEFLRACHAEENATQAWCRRLADLGLLVEQNAEVVSPAGKRYGVTGFHVVDRQALAALPDSDLGELVRDGSMALIDAHILSLEHLVALAKQRDGLQPDGSLGREQALGQVGEETKG